MEYVYLKGKLTNLSGLPLLAGRVSIYRNGSFMGKSELNYAAPGESFALSWQLDLGPDPFKYREVLLEYRVTAPKSFDLDGI